VNTTVDENDVINGMPPAGADGLLSLREAIAAVNADTNATPDTPDTIAFSSMLGSGIADFNNPNGVQFPMISRSVIIDGYTKPDAVPNSASDSDNARIMVQLDALLVIGGKDANKSAIYGLALPGITVLDASNCTISGNFIGLDAKGNPFVGLGLTGVGLQGQPDLSLPADGNTIGGIDSPARNVISGNEPYEVSIVDASNNKVYGNFIGTDLSGQHGVGVVHATGVSIRGNVQSSTPTGNNLVGNTQAAGDTELGEPNVIAFNGGSAIEVTSSSGNRLEVNSIFSNDTLGTPSAFPIKLNSGANNNQAAPQLLSATGSTVTVAGQAPAGTIIFFANDSADAAGSYEGQTFLGKQFTEAVDTSGNATYTFRVPLPVGSFITATVTNNGNTSQFSNGVPVEPSAPPDDGAAIGQLTNLVAAQQRLLKQLSHGKKPPSKASAENLLQIERGFYAVFKNLVATSFTPGDVAFKTLGLKFLDLDKEIEARAEAIVKKDIKAEQHAAVSHRAKVRLGKELGTIEAEVNSELAQDQAFTGELA
jgi:hypothetical protein